MLCNEFEQVIEQNGFDRLPDSARVHAEGCAACTTLLADFAAIVSAASEIPAEVEPPARVWAALQTQLEAEGIIRQAKVVTPAHTTPWWHGLQQLIRGHLVATASVAALVLAIGIFRIPRRTVDPGGPRDSFADTANATASALEQEEQSLGPIQNVSTLSGASNVDNSFRENLATVNAFIKECRKRLQEDPNDQMARDYLATAYLQKAEILAAMMERGRSVN